MSDYPRTPIDRAKYAAAQRAARLVSDGMRVGLGTGSTAAWLVRALGDRVRDEGLRLTAVATSSATERLAAEVGIASTTLADAGWLDLTIDGADEVDGELSLIKGGGGALLQEKIVATASDRMVVIADAAKRVGTLGAFPLPVEVVRFGWQITQLLVEESLVGHDVMGRESRLRLGADGQPVVTDEGHHILDLHLRRIGEPRQLALVLNQVPGVVETGLFLDIADTLIIGYPDGRVEKHEADGSPVEIGRIEVEPRDNVFTEIAE